MSEEKSPMALIIEAIDADDAARVESLLEMFPDQRGIFTPFAGGTWLHYAAEQGSDAVIKYLLESGMDINSEDQWDETNALCSASHNNMVETARLLIENGISLNVSDSVKNPLFAAIVGRSPEIVKLLLEAGIDSKVRYNSKTMNNMDATAFALMRGERWCAEIIAFRNASGSQELASKIIAEAEEVAEVNSNYGGSVFN